MVDTAGVEFADAANLFFKLILRQSESLPFFILALGFAPRVSTLSGYTAGTVELTGRLRISFS